MPNSIFDLKVYNHAVQKELEVISKPKIQTQIISAFIKAETKSQLLNLNVPDIFSRYLPKGQQLKIKSLNIDKAKSDVRLF